MIGKILNTYGTAVTLCQGDREFRIRAFFQPVRSKSWAYLDGEYSPLGEIPRGQYVYIGPADVAVSEGDILLIGERAFSFRRVEPYEYNGSSIYVWGLCVEKGVDDSWGR